MSATETLQVVTQAGVRLTVVGDNLEFEAEYEPPEDLLDEIRCHKVEIIEILRSSAGRCAALTAEMTCLVCGCLADDRKSNSVHEYPDDPVYRRVHFTPDCYDAWFKAAFGKTPAPTTA